MLLKWSKMFSDQGFNICAISMVHLLMTHVNHVINIISTFLTSFYTLKIEKFQNKVIVLLKVSGQMYNKNELHVWINTKMSMTNKLVVLLLTFVQSTDTFWSINVSIKQNTKYSVIRVKESPLMSHFDLNLIDVYNW